MKKNEEKEFLLTIDKLQWALGESLFRAKKLQEILSKYPKMSTKFDKDVKERYDIPLLIHSADVPMLKSILQSGLALFLGAKTSPPPDRLIEEGDEVKIGTSSIKAIHTPGPSPGSLCFIQDGLLFSGDTLFCGGVGRTDLPGGSWDNMIDSIRNKILILSDETLVLPGHGPHSTVGQERNMNPFIR